MGYSKQDIADALQRQKIDPETGESTHKQQISAALEKKGIYLPEHIAGKLATIPISAVQEMGRLTGSIPGSPAWVGKKIIPKMEATMPQALQKSEQATAQLPQRFPQQAGIGKALTDVGYGGALTMASGGLGEAAGVGTAAGTTGAGSLLGAMDAKPGERLKGAAIGAGLGLAAPLAPKLVGLGLKGLGAGAKTIAGLPKMDIIFKSRLAKRLQEAKAAEEEMSATHYSNTFKNTEDFMPQLNSGTQSNIDDLKKIYNAPHDPVREAFDRYEEKPTLQKLHYLKSDLGKIKNKLDKKSFMPGGLSSTERGEQALLGKARENMQNDLDSNFKLLPGNKSAQYAKAQEHYGNNVAPFNAYSSLRKLFSPRGKVSSALYRDLSEHDNEAERLRNIIGLSRTHMNLGRFLHRKYISGGALALGGGLGMYAKQKL